MTDILGSSYMHGHSKIAEYIEPGVAINTVGIWPGATVNVVHEVVGGTTIARIGDCTNHSGSQEAGSIIFGRYDDDLFWIARTPRRSDNRFGNYNGRLGHLAYNFRD